MSKNNFEITYEKFECNDDNINLDTGYYRGRTINRIPDGEGTMEYKCGYDGQFYSKYVGSWKNGKKDGYGIMYYENGERYEGKWKDDKKFLAGTYYYKNGTEKKCYYENGKDIIAKIEKDIAKSGKLLKELDEFIEKNKKGFDEIIKKYNK